MADYHAIAYTDARYDEALPEEEEAGTHKRLLASIRIVCNKPTDALDPASRINFAELYTVQYNCKVKLFGRVDERFHPQFDELRHHVLQRIFPTPRNRVILPLRRIATPTLSMQTHAGAVVNMPEVMNRPELGDKREGPSENASTQEQLTMGSMVAASSASAKGKGRAVDKVTVSWANESNPNPRTRDHRPSGARWPNYAVHSSKTKLGPNEQQKRQRTAKMAQKAQRGDEGETSQIPDADTSHDASQG